MQKNITYSLNWGQNDANIVVAILCATLGFIFFWFLSRNEKIKSIFFSKLKKDEAWIAYVFFQKILGLIFLGLLPGIIVLSLTPFTLQQLGITLNHLDASISYILLISVLILFFNFFVSKNQTNLKKYPETRIENWNLNRILINSLAWTFYFIGYEFLIRGLLLFVCYYCLGFWPAVAINLCFYSITHIPKGLTETIVALPYGLVLCFITVSTGSLLTAFVTHLLLALCNDNYSIYHHPEMRFEKSKNK